jgi:mobilome CxxCx(11)CxxC protein
MENEKDKHNRLRQDAWNNALFSYGYGYLFSHRAKKLKTLLNWITFLGIIVPILIGGIVTTYGTTSPILKYLLIITAPVSIAQLVISVWSVVANWNTSYAYYLETYLDNYNLAEKYENLGKYPPMKNEELKSELKKIDILRSSRDKQDSKYPLSDKEKRKGMRYALRKYKRECAGCHQIPTSMNSTKCGVCGNF